MKANEENMTPTQAAGYIAGVSFGFVRRHYKIFALLIALGGLAIILTNIGLRIEPTRVAARIGDGAFIGATMVAIGVVLWFMFRISRVRPHHTLGFINARTRLMVGFTTLVVAGVIGWWFARNYYRIGPEALEPVALFVGAAVIIATGAFGFLQLVRGIKRLE